MMTAVVGDGRLALIGGAPDSSAVAFIWQQFGQHARASSILGGLLGTGFAGADSFVLLIQGEDGRPRLFCRGAIGATALGGAVPAWIDGDGLSTWAEHLIAADVTRIVVGAPSADRPWCLPASAGVLLAECVILDLATHGSGADDVPGLAAGTDQGNGFLLTDGEFPDAETLRTIRLRSKSASSLADGEVPDANAAVGTPPVVVQSVPGSTVPDPDSDVIPGTPGIPGVVSRVGQSPAGLAATPGPLIDAVPWPSAVESHAGFTDAPDGPAPADAHDGPPNRTELSASLAYHEPPDRIGPLVAALVCPAGHANPPAGVACRWCGAPLPLDTVLVPRPVLGVLRLSAGDVITLDRGVIMGRNPSADLDPDDSDERPHVVKLPSDGDISRTHLRVTLDGWNVLVTDLNSTNGTLVLLPGLDPVQLRPGEPMLIQPGTVVVLADGIDFRYEVTG
jgi:hypothetical protein